MIEISLLSSFVFVMRVVIFVHFVNNLYYSYASSVEFNSLCTYTPVCDVVDIKLGYPYNDNDANYSRVNYVLMTVILGRNITMGTCVFFRPVCSLSAITLMVGTRIVMPAYHRRTNLEIGHYCVGYSRYCYMRTRMPWVLLILLCFASPVCVCSDLSCCQRVNRMEQSTASDTQRFLF